MISFKQFFYEMARNIGDHSWNPYTDHEHSKDFQEKDYGLHKDQPLHKYQNTNDPNIKVHEFKHPVESSIATLDHKKKIAIHKTIISHNEANNDIPFKHDTFSETYRVKGSTPPKHVENLHFNHIEHSDKPIVSDTQQYAAGHHMWRNMTHKALGSGMHVYHYDGNKMHKSNSENLESHLNNSFGKTQDYEHKHMIISKKPLKGIK